MNIINLLTMDIDALNSIEVKGVKNCYSIVAVCNDLKAVIDELSKKEEPNDVETSEDSNNREDG